MISSTNFGGSEHKLLLIIDRQGASYVDVSRVHGCSSSSIDESSLLSSAKPQDDQMLKQAYGVGCGAVLGILDGHRTLSDGSGSVLVQMSVNIL